MAVARGLDEARLEGLLFPNPEEVVPQRPPLEFLYIRSELRRKHVTLQLLWEEYRSHTRPVTATASSANSTGIGLASSGQPAAGTPCRREVVCGLCGRHDPDPQPLYRCRDGGPPVRAVLGCSNYTYAEVTASEQLPDWIDAQVRALEYIRGVPQVVVPDNAKAAVSNPCRYDPDINRTYQELLSTMALP